MPDRFNKIIPRDKTRVHTRPMFPILFANPYPDSSPNAFVGADVYFYKVGEWFEDNANNIFFIDQFTKDTVYFNKLNTANQYHLMRGEFIVTELLDRISYIPVEKGSDKYAHYRPSTIEFEYNSNTRAAASTKTGGVLSINTNSENGMELHIYKLMSIFRHELLHIREEPFYKSDFSDYTFIAHANVYEEQMSYPEFLKTPENYQLHIIKQYVLRVFNEYYKNGNFQIYKFQEVIQDFNNTTGKKNNTFLKVEKKQNHTRDSGPDIQVIVYINEILRTTIQYEYIENAYN